MYRRCILRARTFALPRRTLAVFLEAEQPWWQEATRALPQSNLVPLWLDRGTGTAALLGALEVARRSPSAPIYLIDPEHLSGLRTTASAMIGRYRKCFPELLNLVRRARLVARGRDWLDQILPFLPAIELGHLFAKPVLDRPRRVEQRPAVALQSKRIAQASLHCPPRQERSFPSTLSRAQRRLNSSKGQHLRKVRGPGRARRA